MKILFFPYGCLEFTPDVLEKHPLGGTETGIVRLSSAFASLGHEVFVLSNYQDLNHNPAWISFSQATARKDIDVLIAVRNWKALLAPINAKARYLWIGDAYDSFHTWGLGDKRVEKSMDALLTVSQWQAETLAQASGFALEKTCLLRNGLQLSDFEGTEKRIRKRLIYSSAPQRGLIHLISIFVALKRKHPDLELHVFCTSALLARSFVDPQVQKDPYQEEVLSIVKQIPGCYVHGAVLQKQLAREFMKSAILAYPTGFMETSCITAMEAQAGGCAIVSSRLAALPETVGEAGILISGTPGTPAYHQQFVEAVDQLLVDDALFSRLSNIGKQRAASFDWSERAKGFLNYIKDTKGLT
jgi:glycosyltransferase involved in cell wall biosynthesis